MPGPDAFNEKKRKILQQLNQPEDEYTDLSPIGAVDANIRALVHEINDLDGYVTTSSCAGRIAVFLEGAPKAPDVDHSREPPDPSTTTTTTTASSSSQGKGGGKWLYVSHDPLDTNHLPHDGDLTALFNLPHATPPSFPAPDDPVRFIHFKFEPMILHILTSSPARAQTCHAAALTAGFRESGIAGIAGPPLPTPHVAVRTQGLGLDSLVAYQDGDGVVRPMVSEPYLRTLVHVANRRFAVNAERTERFRNDLLRRVRDAGGAKGARVGGESGEWEAADVRRERKRAEGLRRAGEMRERRAAREGEDVGEGGNGNPLHTDALDSGLFVTGDR